ncbi:PQQ-like beta-propeller repeat protein [Roseobacter sinensis]|uniref:PQQ-like beta-propeller repeat protein n=1 Tax=Roseobacter sinensis TaxID=2931391 RepID=A0ABT3BG89_9RHOB|nr:PQQ-like beta-propeller repeat protein [Roseobacter sp. WL0113]MCV3272596.1 PQQ-like beta-propeller repeat protein [Roseobacter sp. WL0113]
MIKFPTVSVRAHTGLALLAAAVFLTACAEDDIILPGKREDIRSVLQDGEAVPLAAETEDAPRPISLPAQQTNSDWTQGPGSPAFRVAHPALGANPQRVWSANIGAGDGRRQRITADPVVGGGLIYTLDAETLVTATSPTGETVWRRDVTSVRDDAGAATGGGISFNDGRLYVSLGYGALVALDAATGEEIWRQDLEGTGSGRPTIFGDLVYTTSGDDTGWALRAEDGRVEWQLTASPDVNNVLGGPAPAVADDFAIFAFGSGEIQAVFRRGGLRRWDASALGQRFARALGTVSDVTGAPVISGNTVYVGNQSGRIVALNFGSGAREWTAREGAVGPVLPAGDSIFVVSDLGELLRIDASDGSRIWGAQLPNFVKDRPRRRAEIFAHHGPVLAGGRIYVASNDGLLRGFDPESGALVTSTEIPGGATTAPVVAGGVLYVVSTNGQLHAFR